MSTWLYTLRERCTPAIVDGWEEYTRFSGFKHITELVTLDSIMCPGLVEELQDADWDFNVHEDCRITLFRTADYLLKRQALDPARHQLLAVYEAPTRTEPVPRGFTFCGFDIMDSGFGNSTLTNCGPIPEAFAPTDVNEFGLLNDGGTAKAVRDKMRRLNPEDAHLGACEAWMLARRLPSG